MQRKQLTPKELDAQSPVVINRWIDIDSEESKAKDEDRQLTKKMQMIGFEDGWMSTDSFGRIWGYDEVRDIYYPFHFEFNKELIGYRIATKAAN